MSASHFSFGLSVMPVSVTDDFDDWAEVAEYRSITEWRAYSGKDSKDFPAPFRPAPITFTFNFGKLEPAQ